MRWIAGSCLLVASVASAGTKQPPSVLVTASATSNTADAWKAVDHQTPGESAWCGTDGDTITFKFEKPIPITSLDLAGGRDTKTGTIAVPVAVDVTAGAQSEVEAGDKMMKVPLDGSSVGAVTLKLHAAANKKDKTVCLSGIRVLSPSTYYYSFIYGVDRAALDKLGPWAAKLDGALRACDRAGLADTIVYPIHHEHSVSGMQDGSVIKATYKNVDALVTACKDGPLARGFAGVDFDDLANVLPNVYSNKPAEVQIGSGSNNMWLAVWKTGAWKLTAIDTFEPALDVISSLTAGPFDIDVGSHLGTGALVLAGASPWQAGATDGDIQPDSEVATFSRDGNAMWVAFDVKSKGKTWRASEVTYKDAASEGWKIAGGLWSMARPNAEVNKAAAAGKLVLPPPVAEKADGDAELRAAFDKLLTDGLDATAAARKELIAIGSGPGERTKTGAALAKPWKAAWAKKLSVRGGAIAKVLPSGTTGWVMADVLLDKGTYKVPFRVFVVFDKTGAGAWSLVQAHFAVL